MRKKLFLALFLFLSLAGIEIAQAQSGLHLDFRVGGGTIGDPPFLHDENYQKTLLGEGSVVADWEFCIIKTETCGLFVGPYGKFSVFIPESNSPIARVAGGLVTGVSLTPKLSLMVWAGLGYSSDKFKASPVEKTSRVRFTETRTTYDLSLSLRQKIDLGPFSLFSVGISHFSNGLPAGINIPKCQEQDNIGLNLFWLGFGW